MAAVLVITLTQASGAAGHSPGAADTLSPQARELTAYPRAAPEYQRVSQDKRDGTLRGGAAHRVGSPTAPSRTGAVKRGAPARPRGSCPSARNAVKFYAGRIAYWNSLMGGDANGARNLGDPAAPSLNDIRVKTGAASHRCPQYLAHVLQRKAYALRKAYPKWRKRVWEHEYAWWLWLPDKFQRVGRCETGGTAGATSAGNFGWDSGVYVSAFGIYRPAYEAYHHWTGSNTPREQYEVAAAIQARFGWGAWGCGGA